MKCPTCDGKRGWGHYSTEHDMYARRTEKVAGSDKFFACDTCKGSGEVSVTVLRQSLLAEEERQRQFDNEMEQVGAMIDRQFRDERHYN
jgi:hypothetical protein